MESLGNYASVDFLFYPCILFLLYLILVTDSAIQTHLHISSLLILCLEYLGNYASVDLLFYPLTFSVINVEEIKRRSYAHVGLTRLTEYT